jgi:hypothetical protein
MMRVAAVLSLLGLMPFSAVVAQETDARVSLLVGAALTQSPLGELAERHGLYALPGTELEIRLVGLPRGRGAWSVAAFQNRYALDRAPTLDTRAVLDYRATSLVVGHARTETIGSVPLEVGVDLGWVRLRADASVPNFYTGVPESSRVRGDAAVLALSYAVRIRAGSFTLLPRVRLSTNFPDIGGGAGYSGLHVERGLGFQLAFGVGARFALAK